MSTDWKVKGTELSFKWAFASIDNAMQNNLRQIKKSGKVRQNPNTLISDFAYFMIVDAKNIILWKRLGKKPCPYAVLRFF